MESVQGYLLNIPISSETFQKEKKTTFKTPKCMYAYAYLHIALGTFLLPWIVMESINLSWAKKTSYSKAVTNLHERCVLIILGTQLISHIIAALYLLRSADTETQLKRASIQALILRNASIGFIILHLLNAIFLHQFYFFEGIFDCVFLCMAINLQNKFNALVKKRKNNSAQSIAKVNEILKGEEQKKVLE